MEWSKKFDINKEDVKKIIRQFAIIYWPVALLFLDQAEHGTFDYKVLVALFISLSIDVIRRWLKDYTQDGSK